MKIHLTSKQSIYKEVAEKIESFIKLGVYKEGEKLPSCRSLAIELGINPNTIERAYSLLQEKGVIYSLDKKGLFVGTVGSNVDKSSIKDEINHFKQLGIKKDELLQILDEVYKEENL